MRDLDVQLLEWEELVAPLSPERAAELEPLRAMLERRRARERTRLRRGLRGARFATHWPTGARSRTAPADDRRPRAALPIDAVAGERIREGLPRAWCATAARSTTDSPPEALHDLRKRGKELRYLLELFGSPFADDAVVKPMVST